VGVRLAPLPSALRRYTIAFTRLVHSWRGIPRAHGADACIDYAAEDLRAALKREAPDGVDVCYDQVGGDYSEAVLRCVPPLRNRHGGCEIYEEFSGCRRAGAPQGRRASLLREAVLRTRSVSLRAGRAARATRGPARRAE
jgi:hypothetical protein